MCIRDSRTAYGSYDHRVVWGSYASSDKAALPQQAVSYTHLDVYKRQVTVLLTELNKVCFSDKRLPSCEHIQIYSKPVSYTHLDVYKRQVLCTRLNE